MKIKLKRNTFIFCGISILLILSLNYGWSRIFTSDFIAINGDFQNYNVLRRLFDGQIPFKDFSVYLGIGHLVVGALALIFTNGSFTASMFVMNFLTVVFFEIITCLICYYITKDKLMAIYSSIFIVIMNIWRPEFFLNITYKDFFQGLDFAIAPGNSARMIRAGGIIFVSLGVLLVFRIIQKLKENNKLSNKYYENKDIILAIILGAISGSAIVWSNDIGVSSYLSFSFIFFILLIKFCNKKIIFIIKNTIIYIISSILCCITVLLLVTRGNILSWFRFTLGVAEYQPWYYGIEEAWKLYYIYELNNSILIWIAIFFIVMYLYKMFKAKEYKEIRNYGLLSYLLLTGLINSVIYKVLSGGNTNEILYLTLYIIIVVKIIKAVKLITDKLLEEKTKSIKDFSLLYGIFILSFLISQIMTNAINFMPQNRMGTYVEALDGYLTRNSSSINEAVEIIGDEKVFSTYASAIEVATNQYQPTGVDYIIHVLGDKQREDYINNFTEGNYKYAITINPKYTEWEYWVRNSNWFFYKELYNSYKPYWEGDYYIIWEKQQEQNSRKIDYDVIINENEENSGYKIILESDDKNFNGVVDVKLSYESGFNKKFFNTLAVNRFVYVDNISGKAVNNVENYNNYFIPSESNGYNIPITIVNGVGEIEVSCKPDINTYFNLHDVIIGNTYDNY